MNREKAFQALGDLDDRFIAETLRYAPEQASGSPERTVHMKRKRIITFALAAVLLLSLSVAAGATYASVGSPQAAVRVAREQIEVWKQMGILNQDVAFEGDPPRVMSFEQEEGSSYWYGRIFPHHYDVGWFFAPAEDGTRPKYSCNLMIDTLTGKIMTASIFADADEDDVPVHSEEISMPGEETQTWYFYDNFDDLFPADLTVDRFCSLLAEYWGFTGYTIADTVDDFYGTDYEAIEGSTPLAELNSDTRENYYLTVFFEGDQEGAPRYVELMQFPGYVGIMVGTNHAVG